MILAVPVESLRRNTCDPLTLVSDLPVVVFLNIFCAERETTPVAMSLKIYKYEIQMQ